MPITHCFKCGKEGGFQFKDGELSCKNCGEILVKFKEDGLEIR